MKEVKIILVILFYCLTFYSQRGSSNVIVGDSKCGPGGIILDENGKAIVNPIFITGRVYNDDPGKEPIENATVWIKGTKIGTVTNKRGLYGINVKQVNDTASTFTLMATYVGNKTKEIIIKKLKSPATIDIGLLPIVMELQNDNKEINSQ